MEEVEIDQTQPAKPAPQMASAVDAYRERMGKLLTLTEAQKGRLLLFLKNNIDGWLQDTSILHARLRDDNDLVEGVVLDTGFPWPGASIVHVPITETYMEVYHSILRRSILGGGVIWVATTEDELLMEYIDDVADLMNDKAMNEWNVEEALDGVMWTTCRDGLGIIFATWVEEYEPATDILLIDGIDEFKREFTDPDSAGIEAIEYADLAAKAEAATPKEPLEIPVRFEKLTFYGNKCDIVELVDFVTFPATIPDIRHESCRGYGKAFDERKATILKKSKGKSPLYYPDAAQKLLSESKNPSPSDNLQAQDQVEGFGRSTKSNLRLYELAVKFALDPNGDEKKLLITYSREGEILLSVKDYPYRVDHAALFRINKRPNRLVGRSIPQKTRDINDEIDAMHRQRTNSRTISHVPTFILDSNKQREFDVNNPDPTFFPGKQWKVPGGVRDQVFDQFRVQPVDLGDSMSEENNDMKLLDLLMGSAVALLSGQAAPSDPSAPGNKTEMMITQSNLRMDDPLSEFRYGVEQLGDICLSHLYQFGPPVLDYIARTGGGNEPMTMFKKLLRQGLRMKMAGVTITQNPETEMARGFQTFQLLMQWPIFQQNAQGQVEMIRDALRKGRVQRWQKYVPTLEEIQAKQVEVQKAAMVQMAQEKAAAEQKQQEEALKSRMGAVQKDLQIKALADKAATAALGDDGGSENV